MLGAYIVLLPRASVLTLVVLSSCARSGPSGSSASGSDSSLPRQPVVAQPEAGGGVAFFAHVGGFAFGLLAVRAFAIRRPLQPEYW